MIIMGENHPPNPFEIPLIVELVTKYSSPTSLLPCREVNHLWNGFATKKLTAEGWTLNLRSAEQLFEYLRLTRATQNTGSTLPPMNFHVSAVGSTDNFDDDIVHEDIIELNNRMSNAAAIASMRPTNGYFGIQSITCHLQFSGISADLRNLLQLVSPTITQITLLFKNPEWLEPRAPSPVDFDWNFPELRSMCLGFTTSEWDHAGVWNLDARQPQITAVKAIIMASPNLEHIRSTHRQANSPIFMVLAQFEREEGLRAKFQQLTEMDFTRSTVNMRIMSSRRTSQFLHLRVLKISSYDYESSTSGGLPRMFYQRRRMYIGLLDMVIARCPALDSLEITERHGVDVISSVTSSQLHLRLPQLTHFGYRLKLPETGWENLAIMDGQASALCMADLMNRFANLAAVSTNVEACIALGEVYRTTNEYLLPPPNQCAYVPSIPPLVPILRPQLNGVTKLTLDVAHFSVPLPTSALADTTHQDIVQLLRAIFPSFRTLVINLGADPVAENENTKSNLAFLLGVAFEVDTLRRIEVNNYYNGWRLLEPSTPMPPSADPSTNSIPEVDDYDNAAAIAMEALALTRPTLETLVIRGVRPSFVNSHVEVGVDPAAFVLPQIYIAQLRELIPAAIKPGLVLEIDGDLLMNSGLYASYTQLREEMSSLEQPQVRLI